MTATTATDRTHKRIRTEWIYSDDQIKADCAEVFAKRVHSVLRTSGLSAHVTFADGTTTRVSDALTYRIDRDAWRQLWEHFDRMQRRVMHDKTTRAEFFAQPATERLDFYHWLRVQCGSYADYI